MEHSAVNVQVIERIVCRIRIDLNDNMNYVLNVLTRALVHARHVSKTLVTLKTMANADVSQTIRKTAASTRASSLCQASIFGW